MILRCLEPTCRKKFTWNPSEGWPDACPICHAGMANDRADDDVAMPALLSAKTKSGDKLLRDMQNGAQVRAEIAAEAAGVPVSDMKDLVPSDFNMRRDAEIMAMPVSNVVTKQMDGKAQFGFTDGSGYAQAAGSGAVMQGDKVVGRVEPRAGARAQARIQDSLPKLVPHNPFMSKHG